MKHTFRRVAPILLPVMLTRISLDRFAVADAITLTPTKDNTLVEDAKGALSNGAGEFIFSGRVGVFGNERKLRGALAFDLSAIPVGATVTSATLTLTMLQTVSGAQTHALHRLTADWGEGTSFSGSGSGAPAEPGDATWIHTFHPDQLWSSAGGDFAAQPSDTQTVDGPGEYAWTSAALAQDVQDWVRNPAANFGWTLIGNEATPFTSKKFASRENINRAIRPRLEVVFALPAPCPADITLDQQVGITDLQAVIKEWGACVKPCPPIENCFADVTDDCQVNVNDLLAVINAWGPCP